MEAGEAITALVSEALRTAKTSEKVLAAISALSTPVSYIQAAIDADPEIGPEIGAAVGHLEEALGALDRAFTFSHARGEAAMQRITDSIGEPDGD